MVMWQPGITLEQIEKEVILKAYCFYHGNKTQTARALGVSIKTIDNKLEIYKGSSVDPKLAEAVAKVSQEATQRASDRQPHPQRKR